MGSKNVVLGVMNIIGTLGLFIWIAILFLVLLNQFKYALICLWMFVTLMILQNGFSHSQK